MDHARRWGLRFEVISRHWGEAFDIGEIEQVSGVASCVPTGYGSYTAKRRQGPLNDLDALGAVTKAVGVKLCVDAISSIGTVQMSLAGAYFASGVSGKGLGAFPGLAIVFYNHDVSPAPTALPCVLNLGLYARECGVSIHTLVESGGLSSHSLATRQVGRAVSRVGRDLRLAASSS